MKVIVEFNDLHELANKIAEQTGAISALIKLDRTPDNVDYVSMVELQDLLQKVRNSAKFHFEV